MMARFPSFLCSLLAFSLYTQHGSAVTLDISSTDSIKSAASTIAYGMMKYYTGNNTGDVPGMLPSPYYWWEAGAMWGQLVEYWYYTGDSTYNDVVSQALQFQVGNDDDFMPSNQTKDEGNDDQVFWAFAVMSAAETKFPNPPSDKPQWLALAQAVFNEQASRWDTQTCGGGLRWQIFQFNNGYDYKNTISNGGFFQLAARLARYTNNQTYADWAEKMYDWMAQSPLLDNSTYAVNDGSSTLKNCSDADHTQWTYNYATMIAGSAYMYNYTNGSSIWKTRTQGFLNATAEFFPSSYGGNVMSEIACEPRNTCNIDQPSFRAYMSRWLATTTQLAPWTYDTIMPKLQASAQGAAKQCSGTVNGDTNACGQRWWQSTYDGNPGVGQQMSALAIIQANLIKEVAAPVGADTGGTSVGNPNAGGDKPNTAVPSEDTDVITTGDKVGAGILTTFMVLSTLGGAYWMIS